MFKGMATCRVDYPSEAIGHIYHRDVVRVVEFNQIFETVEEAQAVVAIFPRYTRLTVRDVHDASGWIGQRVVFRAQFHTNDVTGPTNETSIKRLRKFLELAHIDTAGFNLGYNLTDQTKMHENWAPWEAVVKLAGL